MSVSPREKFRQSVQATETDTQGPDWTMTFADTMSLLMGFFVLLISFSTFESTKFETIAGGVKATFGGDPAREVAPQPAAPRSGESGRTPLDVPAADVGQALRGSIEAWNRQTDGAMSLTVHETYRGVEVTLPADRLFADGNDQLRPHAEGLLQFVAATLAETAHDRTLVVEVPVAGSLLRAPQFEDDWSLAISRGLAVRGALGSRAQVPGRRVVPAAVGSRLSAQAPQVNFVFEVSEVRPR